MKETTILVIAVIYRTYPEAARYLDSLEAARTEGIRIILVDNSDTPVPEEFQGLVKKYPGLTYLRTGNNAGYFGGARAGMEFYLREEGALPDWILLTNVDIEFDSDFFMRLTDISAGPALGLIAPAIVSAKWKTDYNPALLKPYSRRRMVFFRFLYSNFILHNAYLVPAYLKSWFRGIFRRPPQEAHHEKIYASHGSCLVFHRNYFLKGGDLALPHFLFGEEIYVAEKTKGAGLEIIYHPGLVIRDHEHASVGFFVSRVMNRYYRESIQSMLRLFYSNQPGSHHETEV